MELHFALGVIVGVLFIIEGSIYSSNKRYLYLFKKYENILLIPTIIIATVLSAIVVIYDLPVSEKIIVVLLIYLIGLTLSEILRFIFYLRPIIRSVKENTKAVEGHL